MAQRNGPKLVRTIRAQEEEEPKRRFRFGKLLFFLVALLLAVGAAAYHYYTERLLFTGYETLSRTEWAEGGSYLKSEKGLIRYTDNGAQAVDENGNLLWNITYEMKDPMLACCGEMTAIAERGGRRLLVTDAAGTVREIATLYNIQAVAAAEQGVTAVLMNAAEKDYISLYDKNGTLLSEINTVVKNDGFPQAVALSKDGRKLVTAYLMPEGDSLISCVTFYNFGGVGENHIRNIVGQVQYENTLVPRLAFLDNDTLGVFYETGFELFSMKEVPASVAQVTFDEKIRSIAVGSLLVFVLENKTGNDRNHLVAYDKQGKKRMDLTNSYSYDTVAVGEEEVILHGTLSCLILRTDGRTKFRHEFETNIKELFPIGRNRYFLVSGSEAQTIKLIKARAEEEEAE